MLFSIIVPVYNSEKYLKNTIESVVNQSFTDWQLVLVNDGSHDKSLEICNGYRRTDDRIIVISQENTGPSAARNNGIAHAVGDYIMFLDSDDEYLPGAFKAVAKRISATGADVIMSSARVINVENNEVVQQADYILSDDVKTIDELCVQISRKRVGPSPWRYAIRREIIQNNKVFFPEGIFLAEDCLWVNGILGYAQTAAFNTSPFYSYNLHADSITATIKYSRLRDLMYVCERLFDLAEGREGAFRNMHLTYCCVLSNTLLQHYSEQTKENKMLIKQWINQNKTGFDEALKTIWPIKAAAAVLGNFNAMLLFAELVKLKLKR